MPFHSVVLRLPVSDETRIAPALDKVARALGRQVSIGSYPVSCSSVAHSWVTYAAGRSPTPQRKVYLQSKPYGSTCQTMPNNAKGPAVGWPFLLRAEDVPAAVHVADVSSVTIFNVMDPETAELA